MIISSVPTTNANKQNRIERTRTTSSGLTAGVRTRKKGLNFPCDEWKFIRLRFRRSFVRCSLFLLLMQLFRVASSTPFWTRARKVIVIMKIMMLHPTTNTAATVTSSWTSSGVDKQQNENTGLQTAYTTSQSSNAALSRWWWRKILLCMRGPLVLRSHRFSKGMLRHLISSCASPKKKINTSKRS